MATCDFAYLPYWFDGDFRDSVRLCFPTKLGTYLSSGVPILYHGPRNSSPTQFLERYPAGVCCHSNARSEIIDALACFTRDPKRYQDMNAAGQVALDEALNYELFRLGFHQLLGFTESRSESGLDE